mgnify:CR=1 FL=1
MRGRAQQDHGSSDPPKRARHSQDAPPGQPPALDAAGSVHVDGEPAAHNDADIDAAEMGWHASLDQPMEVDDAGVVGSTTHGDETTPGSRTRTRSPDLDLDEQMPRRRRTAAEQGPQGGDPMAVDDDSSAQVRLDAGHSMMAVLFVRAYVASSFFPGFLSSTFSGRSYD